MALAHAEMSGSFVIAPDRAGLGAVACVNKEVFRLWDSANSHSEIERLQFSFCASPLSQRTLSAKHGPH